MEERKRTYLESRIFREMSVRGGVKEREEKTAEDCPAEGGSLKGGAEKKGGHSFRGLGSGGSIISFWDNTVILHQPWDPKETRGN